MDFLHLFTANVNVTRVSTRIPTLSRAKLLSTMIVWPEAAHYQNELICNPRNYMGILEQANNAFVRYYDAKKGPCARQQCDRYLGNIPMDAADRYYEDDIILRELNGSKCDRADKKSEHALEYGMTKLLMPNGLNGKPIPILPTSRHIYDMADHNIPDEISMDTLSGQTKAWPRKHQPTMPPTPPRYSAGAAWLESGSAYGATTYGCTGYTRPLKY